MMATGRPQGSLADGGSFEREQLLEVLKVSFRDALGLSSPISQRIDLALFLTQTLHEVADSLELPTARDSFLTAFRSLAHARENTDSICLPNRTDAGPPREPSQLNAQSLASSGHSKQILYEIESPAINGNGKGCPSPVVPDDQASATSQSDTALLTPTASRSSSVSGSSVEPADTQNAARTKGDASALPSRHRPTRDAAPPLGSLKIAGPGKPIKRVRTRQEDSRKIPSKKAKRGADKDRQAGAKEALSNIHKSRDAEDGGVQTFRHAVESSLAGRKIMPDCSGTVDELVHDLQEFADSLSNAGNTATYAQWNLPGFVDGIGKTFATFASYFEKLMEDIESARLTRTLDMVPPEGDRAQQCLHYHRAFRNKSAQCNILTLGRLHDLYQLRAAHYALIEELTIAGKPIHDWALTNSLCGSQKAAICTRYLAHLASLGSPKESEAIRLSIQHDLALSSKLYDITRQLGPGFVILLARHLVPSHLLKIQTKSLQSFFKEFKAIFPGVCAFSKQLWSTVVSCPAPGMFSDKMTADLESSLFELLESVDQTESKVISMVQRWEPQRPSAKSPIDAEKAGEYTSQHSYNKSIQAIFDQPIMSPPGLPFLAKKFLHDDFGAIPGFGTLYGPIHCPSQAAAIKPAWSSSHLTQMLSKEFSLIIVLGQSGIRPLRVYDEVEEMARFPSDHKIEAVYSSCPISRHGTRQIARTVFKRIFVDVSKRIKPEEEGYSVNCLGIPSIVVFPMDDFLLGFDLVELIVQNAESTGVVLHDLSEIQELYDDIRRGWWLYTTPGAFSTFHKDKAGFCTILSVEEGQKDWFVTHDGSTRAVKEGFCPERISGISIGPGSLAIQGPGVLHSVFTPVLSKVFGRFFWHMLLFHKTVDTIAIQILNATEENEVILANDYRLLTLIFRNLRFAKLEDSVVEKIVKSVRHLIQAIGAPKDGDLDHRDVSGLELFADKHVQPNQDFLETCPRWARVLIERDGIGKAWGQYRHCSEYTYMVWFVDEATRFMYSVSQSGDLYRGDRSPEPYTRRRSNHRMTSVEKAQAIRKSTRRIDSASFTTSSDSPVG